MAPKLYLFHNMLAKYIFKKRFFVRRRVWLLQRLRSSTAFRSMRPVTSTTKDKILTLRQPENLQILGRYLYQSGGKYTTVLLYTTKPANQRIHDKLLLKSQEILGLSDT